MLHKSLLPLALMTATLTATPVFIGTGRRGIYRSDFDAKSGTLTKPELAADYGNPGFLALHPTRPLLYCTGRPNQPMKDDNGSVATFEIGADGGLSFVSEFSSGGKNPCHLAVDATGKTLAVANYGDGHIATIRLGSPDASASVVANTGSGPKAGRQEGPHAHGVYFDGTNSFLFVPDLGIDRVFVYPFDSATSKLGEPLPPLQTAPGAGPRHMAFSPDYKNAYVIDELANDVTIADYKDGKFKVIGTVPTLPADFEGSSSSAEIEVHPNGKFVYGSNRGDDSIAVYKRDPETGLLTLVQHAKCGGRIPRHFKIAPGGKWLICAHQDSNDISVLPLDPETGRLGEPASTVPAPAPICILFGRDS